ncbi:MAG TPA: NAD-dependent epimerase/dehydratase family protein [Gaiellaceae bacterium]|nr:NAD-dependent epimerase/dehydratase family protein [Gaiellaceae bacterium]
MRLLVLGGTKFLGRAAVEAALARGHEVTLFNRGETNPELFPEAEQVRGDRTQDLSALDGREWDSVLDTAGYLPAVVQASAEALRDATGHYAFVSSVSVYADQGRRNDESAPTAALGDLPPDALTEDFSNYGPLKALCEEAVRETYGDRTVVVRPGLIVGAHDPSGRFTYWPHRVARGGEVVAPAPPERQVQFIDVRDLGSWLVDLAERRTGGTFNATHPGLPFEDVLTASRQVTGSDATLAYVPDALLVEHEVGEWMELPLWLTDPQFAGMLDTDVSRALEAGLTFRPLEETVRDTLEHAAIVDGVGLTPEREAELLAAAT